MSPPVREPLTPLQAETAMVLECGQSLLLLQACEPTHAFCRPDPPPPLRLALSAAVWSCTCTHTCTHMHDSGANVSFHNSSGFLSAMALSPSYFPLLLRTCSQLLCDGTGRRPGCAAV